MDNGVIIAFSMIMGIYSQHYLNGSPFLASIGVCIGVILATITCLIVERMKRKWRWDA